MLASGIPAGAPEFPTNLEGDYGFAGAGGHGQQDSLFVLQNRLHDPIDGDFLIVAGTLSTVMIVR